MKPKISIIVPIYNVEQYLRRCLDSLLDQSIQDIEIIAVNDGSTDQSLKVLKEYADKDVRIVLVDKQNGGVSSARNEGLQLAKGEYIGFVDPDDWVNSEMYATLYEAAITENADIVMCTYMREFGTHSKKKAFDLPDRVTYIGEDVISKVMRRIVGPINEEIANPELLDAWGTVWSKIYRASLIKDNSFWFTDLTEIGTNEDSLFNIKALYYANSFVFLNQPFYHYWRVNTGSVTSGYKADLLNQWFNLYQVIDRFLEDKNIQAECKTALNNRICLNTLGLGLNTISPSNKSPVISKIEKLHKILNDTRIKRSFKQFELSYFPIVWRAFYYCAKIRFAAGFYFMLVGMDTLRKLAR